LQLRYELLQKKKTGKSALENTRVERCYEILETQGTGGREKADTRDLAHRRCSLRGNKCFNKRKIRVEGKEFSRPNHQKTKELSFTKQKEGTKRC
jgi:hypothetical protein